MGRSCSNLVHIDQQYWRKGTHAGVSQWPLWKKHCLPSFHPRQKSVFFRMLKAENAWAWQTPRTLCWEDCFVAAAAVWPLPGILPKPGIPLHVPIQSRNEQSIEQLLPCRKNTSNWDSLRSCQCCQLMGRWCSNPVHIDHQYWRKGTHDTCRCQPVVTLARKPFSSQFPSSPKQCLLRNVLVQSLASLANWCGVHAGSQFTSITSTEQTARTHAGVKQWPLKENPSLHTFHPRKGSEWWRESPS